MRRITQSAGHGQQPRPSLLDMILDQRLFRELPYAHESVFERHNHKRLLAAIDYVPLVKYEQLYHPLEVAEAPSTVHMMEGHACLVTGSTHGPQFRGGHALGTGHGRRAWPQCSSHRGGSRDDSANDRQFVRVRSRR